MRGYYKLFALTMVLFALNTAIYSQKVMYSDSWGTQGFSLLETDANEVQINYSLTEFFLEDLNIDGLQTKSVKVPGIFLPNNEGAPDLAGTGKYVAIPQGAEVSYSIIASRTEKIENVEIAPAPRIPLDTDEGPLHYEKNTKIYSKNAFYPSENVQLKTSKIRGVDVVMVGITPFQYNPVTKELIIYRDLQVELNISGGAGHIGDDRLRSRWWDPIIHDAVLNPNAIPKIDYSAKPKSSKATGYEYLIIVPDDPVFISWAESIKTFRKLQGITTDIVTTTEVGGNTTSSIELYVNNAYATWDIPPAAVLLIGDYGTSGNTVVSPIYNSYCVSDNIYADVDDDQLPEIVFARMTAQNATHLETMITKFLDYEQTPPTDAYFYNHPITALGWQTERWFQICSETVGGFWKNAQFKDPIRINEIYSGTPGSVWSTATNTSTVVDYFGPDGLDYLPATPNLLGEWSGGNATMINDALNSGAFMLQHRDHGGETGWGEPAYSSSDIDGLTNTNLSWIFSINCLTGKYNISGECFAEKFHRYKYNDQNSGALGITAASEVSYSFVNDTYVWGLMDNMWTNFMPDYGTDPPSRDVLPAFGNAAGKIFLEQSSWPYNTSNKEVTYHLFHHHGDAFTTVYSEVPQDLTVSHSAVLYIGTSSFDVSAEEGALIALTVEDGEDVLILGTGIGAGIGIPVSITFEALTASGTMTVTITKQNYYRNSSIVNVIAPTGPYVVYNTHTINDPSGNGNGEADFNENILLDMTIENVGIADASDVMATLSSSDPFITINNSTATYGFISSGETSEVNNAFEVEIANDVPDQHIANFELAIDGNADITWDSQFAITLNAPALETGPLTINDGNGKLDPGETIDIIIETTNAGHSDSPLATGTLTSSSPYITINSGIFDLGTITMGATELATFNISVSGTAPQGTFADFGFDVISGNYSASNNYNEVIGQVPVLILDLDPNASSGPEMGLALTANGVSHEYLTVFPADLNIYSSVFVCLGIYSSNYVLSSNEGTSLTNYLNNGGNLYMEGGDTWAYDSQTTVHGMFNINGSADGTSDMSTVAGQAGTMTESMSFSYSGENNWMDHLDPISPAILIFENQATTPYGTGVAYDAGTYKTIGTSHEFGGLDDGLSPSIKSELMFEYLKFFNLVGTSVNLTAYLEGPFLITEMATDLNLSGYLPLSQPYSGSPWNYFGTAPITSIPNSDIVDWVLVELRETTGDASTATPATVIAQKAGFILNDGAIVDTDGISSLRFDIIVTSNLYAVIYHRNHLGIMSANPLTILDDTYVYDFTSGAEQAYGGLNGHKEITAGIYGMTSGDADGDREIDNKDKNEFWKTQMGNTGYFNGDFDMNGIIDLNDKINKWKFNSGNCSFIVK